MVLVAEIPPLWHFDFALCGPGGRLGDEFGLRVRVRRWWWWWEENLQHLDSCLLKNRGVRFFAAVAVEEVLARFAPFGCFLFLLLLLVLFSSPSSSLLLLLSFVAVVALGHGLGGELE